MEGDGFSLMARQVDTLTKEMGILFKQNELYRKEREDLEKHVEEGRRDIEELIQANTEQLDKLGQGEESIRKLLDTEKVLREEVESLAKKNMDLEEFVEEYGQVRSALEDVTKDKEMLQKEAKELRLKVSRLDTEVKKRGEERKDYQRERETMHKKTAQQLKEEQQKIVAQKKALEAENAQLRSGLDLSSSETDFFRRAKATEESRWRKVVRESEQVARRLERELASARSESNDLNERVKELQTELNYRERQSKERIDEAMGMVDRMKMEKEELVLKKKTMEGNFGKQMEIVGRMENDLRLCARQFSAFGQFSKWVRDQLVESIHQQLTESGDSFDEFQPSAADGMSDLRTHEGVTTDPGMTAEDRDVVIESERRKWIELVSWVSKAMARVVGERDEASHQLEYVQKDLEAVSVQKDRARSKFEQAQVDLDTAQKRLLDYENDVMKLRQRVHEANADASHTPVRLEAEIEDRMGRLRGDWEEAVTRERKEHREGIQQMQKNHEEVLYRQRVDVERANKEELAALRREKEILIERLREVEVKDKVEGDSLVSLTERLATAERELELERAERVGTEESARGSSAKTPGRPPPLSVSLLSPVAIGKTEAERARFAKRIRALENENQVLKSQVKALVQEKRSSRPPESRGKKRLGIVKPVVPKQSTWK